MPCLPELYEHLLRIWNLYAEEQVLAGHEARWQSLSLAKRKAV
jgi:hypothetical protein